MGHMIYTSAIIAPHSRCTIARPIIYIRLKTASLFEILFGVARRTNGKQSNSYHRRSACRCMTSAWLPSSAQQLQRFEMMSTTRYSTTPCFESSGMCVKHQRCAYSCGTFRGGIVDGLNAFYRMVSWSHFDVGISDGHLVYAFFLCLRIRLQLGI